MLEVLEVLEKQPYRGFPKIRGTFLEVPIGRIIVFWGVYWGPPILGNYHITCNAAYARNALLVPAKVKACGVSATKLFANECP